MDSSTLLPLRGLEELKVIILNYFFFWGCFALAFRMEGQNPTSPQDSAFSHPSSLIFPHQKPNMLTTSPNCQCHSVIPFSFSPTELGETQIPREAHGRTVWRTVASEGCTPSYFQPTWSHLIRLGRGFASLSRLHSKHLELLERCELCGGSR